MWNSLLAIDPAGTVKATYDKVHLVPFGEYIPFHKEWPPLTGLIGRGSFEIRRVAYYRLRCPGLPPFSPLICYEAIFPGAVTGPASGRVALECHQRCVVRRSSGPYQHLTSARLRTVEERLADDPCRQHRRFAL